MIVLDANILLYAYDAASAYHAKARAWVEQIFSGSETVGLPWPTIGAFLRIATNRHWPGQRLTLTEGIELIDSWLAQPNVRVLLPGDHWSILRTMILDGQASGLLVPDAQLAALTIEYGGALYTTDRDFSRFPGLRWKNPLA